MALELEAALANFSRIYLGGIPPMITNDSAFLAFICIVTATEALCSYRYGNEYDKGKMGSLFKRFVSEYFPDAYEEYAADLWAFRNKLIHAFSTGRFLLTHHNSHKHYQRDGPQAVAVESGNGGGLIAVTAAPQYISATGNVAQPSALADGIILNAEDLYAALLSAAQRYFSAVRQSADLQAVLRERIESEEGAITIREIEFGGLGQL